MRPGWTFFQQLDQLRALKQRATLATLVNTQGMSPRKEGAKMWVGEGGQILGSVTIGGCVDAQVIEQSEDVLHHQTPCLIELPLGEEEAWELGLSCAGTLEILLEPFSAIPSEAFACYATLQSHLNRGARGALLTCLDGAAAGAKLLLLDDGKRCGSLGDPALDEESCRLAQPLLDQTISRTLALPGTGGTVRVFVDVYAPPATLIIVGAGDVAMSLVHLAHGLDFRTVVVDSRPRFANSVRFPEADDLRVGIPSEIVKTLPLNPLTAVILVAHDYKYEVPILRHVLSSSAGYIGMLGSRRRGDAILKFLQEDGVTEDALRRVRVPIGLDLGGQSVPEIALAILAEVVSVRYGGSNLPLSRKAGA